MPRRVEEPSPRLPAPPPSVRGSTTEWLVGEPARVFRSGQPAAGAGFVARPASRAEAVDQLQEGVDVARIWSCHATDRSTPARHGSTHSCATTHRSSKPGHDPDCHGAAAERSSRRAIRQGLEAAAPPAGGRGTTRADPAGRSLRRDPGRRQPGEPFAASSGAARCSRCSCSTTSARDPRYGNQLMERIASATAGVLQVNPNTMYPLLRQLEARETDRGQLGAPRAPQPALLLASRAPGARSTAAW